MIFLCLCNKDSVDECLTFKICFIFIIDRYDGFNSHFNIEVYSTTFLFLFKLFSVFMMGDENMRRKNAPGYLQIVLLVYAAKWPRLNKKGLNVFLEK